jgi:beta-phosphoglucomutase-like phosphatase (HAD superfamily)/dTDP-glucose pyrophosphorylase
MVTNKLICFDLDGVLVDSKEIHYHSLNEALEKLDSKYAISYEEHLSTYDGLSTNVKLQMLTKHKGLPLEAHEFIWNLKQDITTEYFNCFVADQDLIASLKLIKEAGIKIAVASNCIRRSVQNALYSLRLLPYVDYFVSAEEVSRKKPAPDLYWQCMIHCNSTPENTVIFEDSHVGQQAALASGASVICVKNRRDLTLEKVQEGISILQEEIKFGPKPQMKDLNVLIPMAGRGSRFATAGYTFPKPLIDVKGKPMIQWVVENVGIKANYTFIAQQEHITKYSLPSLLNLISPGAKVVPVDGVTQGAACTALLASDVINNDNPLLILNSDQYLEWDPIQSLYLLENSGVDGAIFTFESTHPKWSYVRREPGTTNIVEVAEKKPISHDATCGVYWWRHGKDFVKYVNQMIEADDRTLGEFYICPAYNYAINDGKKISAVPVRAMHGLGTPEDLAEFLKEFA